MNSSDTRETGQVKVDESCKLEKSNRKSTKSCSALEKV